VEIEEDLLSSALDNLPLPSAASSPQHRPCPRAPHSIWPSSGAWLRALPRSSSPRATSSIAGHTQAQDATTWVSTPEGDEAQGGRGAKRRQVAPTLPDANGATHTRRP
jgi:hypothetical protein